MARKINVSFKEIPKEIQLYETIVENYSDKSAFMKEAALFYLTHLNKAKVEVKSVPVKSTEENEADEIMGIIGD